MIIQITNIFHKVPYLIALQKCAGSIGAKCLQNFFQNYFEKKDKLTFYRKSLKYLNGDTTLTNLL